MSGLELIVLASGSRGNCTWLRAGGTTLLIDAGISTRRIVSRLAEVGRDPREIDAIVVTHEHGDHVYGLRTLLRTIGSRQLHGTKGTLAAVSKSIDGAARFEPFAAGGRFQVGEITIDTFAVPHDASDPVGLALEWRGLRVGYVTDLGHVTDEVSDGVADCDLLVFEANHDREMLLNGPYPERTKRRVASRVGHLSNEHAAAELVRIVTPRTQALVLAHLSETNNDPGLARATVEAAIGATGAETPRVVTACQHVPLEPLVL